MGSGAPPRSAAGGASLGGSGVDRGGCRRPPGRGSAERPVSSPVALRPARLVPPWRVVLNGITPCHGPRAVFHPAHLLLCVTSRDVVRVPREVRLR